MKRRSVDQVEVRRRWAETVARAMQEEKVARVPAFVPPPLRKKNDALVLQHVRRAIYAVLSYAAEAPLSVEVSFTTSGYKTPAGRHRAGVQRLTFAVVEDEPVRLRADFHFRTPDLAAEVLGDFVEFVRALDRALTRARPAFAAAARR
jgi:hypothetical protein